MEMFESQIAFNHNYFVSIFDSPSVKTLNQLVNLLKKEYPHRRSKIYNDSDSGPIYHLQININKLYGRETALRNNRVEDGQAVSYWYDFYLGTVKLKATNAFFICYPYSAFIKYIDKDVFTSKQIKRTYHKPEITSVLEHFKGRNSRKKAAQHEKNLDIDITKYTADISSDINAKKISLTGVNPLESKTYKVLVDNFISITPVALTLKFAKAGVLDLELAFNKQSSKFWMRKKVEGKKSESNLPLLIDAFVFLSNIEGLYGSSVVPNT